MRLAIETLQFGSGLIVCTTVLEPSCAATIIRLFGKD